jgi:hypothetical protein
MMIRQANTWALLWYVEADSLQSAWLFLSEFCVAGNSLESSAKIGRLVRTRHDQ